MKEPIKRIEQLKALSREHHHGLLLCWKIREGIKRNIETERIKKYVDWFWDNHLQQHFKTEENLLFPILGSQNELIQQALTEHRRLKRLFENKKDIHKSISLIEEELEKHIRFEERVLFNEIQKVATPQELDKLYTKHNSDFQDNIADEFWMK